MVKAMVTGAAGFIGSYLVDELLAEGSSVVGVDNMSAGKMENVEANTGNSAFSFVKLDLREEIGGKLPRDVDVVFHLAADPEVRTGLDHPESQFENNILATYNMLEFARKSGVKRFCLASSSTVYGEPKVAPTPEDYAPLLPISIYGCSKLACETMAFGYGQTFGIQITVFRPANVVGGRGTHGVLLDFIAKLRADPRNLLILGDGSQAKSYVHASDVAKAFVLINSRAAKLSPFEVFNVGNAGKTSVRSIAEIVSSEMGISPSYTFSGGVDGGRAWKGDVRSVLLSIDKVRAAGWAPNWSSDDSVRRSVAELLSRSARGGR